MPYTKVEDTETRAVAPVLIRQGGTRGWDGSRTPSHHVASSGKMTEHTIWRCYSCKAMAVTKRGEPNPGKCAKCGR